MPGRNPSNRCWAMDENKPMSAQPVCPWWMRFVLFAPFRKGRQGPSSYLAEWVKPGMTVADVGCGTGILTLPLAEMVGNKGKVIAIDLQPEMLAYTRKQAEQHRLVERIVFQQASANSLGPLPVLDFAVTAWMLHEVPDRKRLLGDIKYALKAGGIYLFFEPIMHVSKKSFEQSCALIQEMGFREIGIPKVTLSHAMVFEKPDHKK